MLTGPQRMPADPRQFVPADVVREFAPDEVPAAAKFIESLPATTRVYVDVWGDEAWHFAFFDDQRFAAGTVALLLKPGQRFRVRARSSPDALPPPKSRTGRDAPAPLSLVPPRKRDRRWRGLRGFLRHWLD